MSIFTYLGAYRISDILTFINVGAAEIEVPCKVASSKEMFGNHSLLLSVGMHQKSQATRTLSAALDRDNTLLFTFGTRLTWTIVGTVHFIFAQWTITVTITDMFLMHTNPENN